MVLNQTCEYSVVVTSVAKLNSITVISASAYKGMSPLNLTTLVTKCDFNNDYYSQVRKYKLVNSSQARGQVTSLQGTWFAVGFADIRPQEVFLLDVVEVVLLLIVVSPELLPEPGRLRDLDDDEDVQDLKKNEICFDEFLQTYSQITKLNLAVQ